MKNEQNALEKYSSLNTSSSIELESYETNKPYSSKSIFNGASYNNHNKDENKIDVRELFRQIRKHKWLILSVVTIITTLVAIQQFRTKPWYTASTVLEVGKENSMVLKSGDVTLNDDSDPQFLVNVNTKKLVLDDPELFEKVVLDQNIDKNPRIVEIVNKKSSLSFLSSVLKNDEQNATQVSGNTPQENKETLRLSPFVMYIQTSLAVEHVKNTRALRISFTDPDPVLAANIANSIAKIFMERSFDNQTARFTNSADWLDSSTRELKAKVQTAEENLVNYTRDNQIYSTDIGAEGKNSTLTTSRLTQLHDQFIRARSDRTIEQSLYEQVRAGQIAELPDAFSDPKITQYQQQLAALETQAAELKVKFGPANPKIIETQNKVAVLTSQIEASRRALEGKLKADYERAVNDEQSFGSALNAAKVAAVNENQASIKYNILKQDVETARELYTDFLQKTNQAKAQVAEQNNNIKVIQFAKEPIKSVGPNRAKIILASFALSLALGIGLALFIEHLDDTIKSLEDVERYAQLPALGVVPKISDSSSLFFKRKECFDHIAVAEDGSQLGIDIKESSLQTKLLLNLDSHSMSGEAYRALRTSLLLSTAGTPPKTILVTSGQASEGKSTTAVNIAISLAQLGSKVLIVDCDLRRPSVRTKLGISQVIGVTNYLSSNTEVDLLIQDLAIPNLYVIPAGPLPPNPAELLSSQKMKDLIKILGEQSDHVIIDSPPIVNVTDPIILSTLVDGTIMVINSGKTTRAVAQRSRQELSGVRAKILGVVLNNVDIRKEGYNYYYKYSSYSQN